MYRLGFIVDLLSHATIVGFMGGVATTVCLQQLKSFVSVKQKGHDSEVVSVLHALLSQVHKVISCFTLQIPFISLVSLQTIGLGPWHISTGG